MLQARNLSVGYNEQEDRLLLACTDGVQVQHLWLTRRMTGRLVKSASDLLEKSSLAATRAPIDLRGELIAFEHQSAMAQPDAVRPGGLEQPAAGLRDLGMALVRRVQIDVLPTQFRLVFHGSDGALVELLLLRADLHRLLAVFNQYATVADWGFGQERDWLGPGAAGPGGTPMAS